MAERFRTKLGSTRAGNRCRIWLQGSRLTEHGFAYGAHVQRIWSEGKLVLRVVDAKAFADLAREDRTTVCDSEARPVIDINTAKVAETFKRSHVLVAFAQGRITITDDEGE
jgi:hypothetical protein